MKKSIISILLTVISLAVPSIVSFAEVYIKKETRMKNGNQPEQIIISEQWLSKNKMAIKTGTNILIIDKEVNKVFFIDGQKKSVVETVLPLDMYTIMPDNAIPQMKVMDSLLALSSASNGKTKKIGSWDTEGFDITQTIGGQYPLKISYWICKNVGFDYKTYADLFYETNKARPEFGGEKLSKELQKYEGFVIATEMEDAGTPSIKMTVLEINPDAKSPAGIFSVPKDYTKKDKLEIRTGK